jgi:hypothetical protein
MVRFPATGGGVSKELHVCTGGLDPFVFLVGDVLVHVHAGVPKSTGAVQLP